MKARVNRMYWEVIEEIIEEITDKITELESENILNEYSTDKKTAFEYLIVDLQTLPPRE